MRLWTLLPSNVLTRILMQFIKSSLRTTASQGSFIAAFELIFLVATTTLVVFLQPTLGFTLVVELLTIAVHYSCFVQDHWFLVRVGFQATVRRRLDGALVLVSRIRADIWK